MEKKPHKLIQSYLQEGYFISTVYLQSSAPINTPSWYYETIVWEWDKDTRERGKIIEMEDSTSYPDTALKSHFNIAQKLLKETP